ncbi:M48 family metalloprotease [Phenylobacterium sp.]|jgi:Zn-dependent protease with chaperone function|uniref:M48 family metalloprotease n=1 Tax=Phenylobacterium sp. TaxID=1871053 RepID=UPI002F424E20
MLAVNGLFGWIQANDRRSIALFGGFALALQLAAALTLYLPLAGFDETHAPFLNWDGYAVRYVPLVALAAAAIFALQMAWHVHSVRRVAAFDFVDHQEEPRLCDIVEALAIARGLPTPYVGVIDSAALNAFACGIRQGDAVVVVTRGLIAGLDDEELAAVVAHELAHIGNGDIRLMAAANICLSILRRLMLPRRPKPVNPLIELIGLPLVIFVAPPLFVAVMILAFLSQCAVRAGHGVRALIGASREFVADAAAVEATQNPAALVSALKKIEGRSRIAGLPALHESMMIDGAAAGPYATHPSIGQRVKALIAVTGSMALIAPSRRDTRRTDVRGQGFGRRSPGHPAQEAPAHDGRFDVGDGRNWLGLSRMATLGAAVGLIAFVGWRGAQLHDPRRLLAEFDPRPATAVGVVVSRNAVCGLGQMVGRPMCAPDEMDRLTRRYASQPGALGRMFASMASEADMRYRGYDGTLRDSAPAEMVVAEEKAKRCFVTDSYVVGQFGLHPVVPGDHPDDKFAIDHWIDAGDVRAQAVVRTADHPDVALAGYLAERKERLRMVHAYFAAPGLTYALSHFDGGDHPAAVAVLRRRLQDPAYVAALAPIARAEMQLLAEAPDAFVPCRARVGAGGPVARTSTGSPDPSNVK